MITDYHAKLFAHELRKRHSAADSEKLAVALLNAQVDSNPHQVERHELIRGNSYDQFLGEGATAT